MLSISISSCNTTSSEGSSELFEYSFDESDYDWESFFTGYNVGWEDNMEFETAYRGLPEPLDTERMSHFIAATNRSDDVKMLFRREVSGLEPNTEYNVQFTIRFATNVPSDCAGIGGAPGESVRVIASASSVKPAAFLEDDYYWLNNQYKNENPGQWYQNRIMGDIANSQDCENVGGADGKHEIKEIASSQNHDNVVTDENGNAWLMFGTRSGFEGRTGLFYTYFAARFTN